MMIIGRRFTIIALASALFAIGLSAAVVHSGQPDFNLRVTMTCNSIAANRCLPVM